MLEGIAKDRSVLECARAAVGLGPEQVGDADDRLHAEMFTQPQIVEELGNQFRIPARWRVGRKAHFRRRPEGCVKESAGRDQLVERYARADIEVAETLCLIVERLAGNRIK